MRMGQGVRTGLGHGVITCVLQTQFSSLNCKHHVSCAATGSAQAMIVEISKNFNLEGYCIRIEINITISQTEEEM